MTSVPASRLEEVRARLAALQAHDLPTHGGRTLAYVYDSGLADVDALAREALARYAASNGLDPTAFPSLLAMENDLVGLAGRLLRAPDGFAGSVTSGGTESVLLAVQAARDARPDIASPSMVLPSTAHAAFHKAAHYFRVRAVVVDVDPVTYRADPLAMEAAVDGSTVLVVASAPSYAHGVVDPVPPIASLALDHGIRCHVDACIGGWVLPFLSDVAVAWDFGVPGVTSVSVDLHKYAYTPKGVSILVHRSADLRLPQLFASAQWPGYTMLNSTLQSTKSGGPLAAAWAVVTAIGEDGYRELARVARQGALDLAAAVSPSSSSGRVDTFARETGGLEGLRLVAPPDATLVCLASTDERVDVLTLADEMAGRGWYVQPQLAFGGTPATLHLSLCAATAPAVPELVVALGDSVTDARAQGPARPPEEVASALATLDPASLDESTFTGLLAAAGLTGADGGLALPDRMAPVNALLDAAPPHTREILLRAVLDRLLRPAAVSTR